MPAAVSWDGCWKAGLSSILADVLGTVERLIDQGRYEAAVKALSQFGADAPDYPAARRLLIRCHIEQGRFGAAYEVARCTRVEVVQADCRLRLWVAFVAAQAGDEAFAGLDALASACAGVLGDSASSLGERAVAFIGGIMLAGAALVLKSPQRRQAIGSYTMPVVEGLLKEMERSAALEQHGLAGLREILLAALPDPDVKQQAAILLARHDEPLLAREVQERLLRHFPSERVPMVTEIRAALKDGSEFVQPERYRWQFGRGAGPWRGRYQRPDG